MKSPVEVIDSGHFSPCEVMLNLSEDEQRVYRCERALRLLPGRRLTALASCEDKSYVIKIFPQRTRSLNEFNAELDGYQLLHNASVTIPARIYYGKAEQGVNIILYQYIERGRTLLEICDELERTRAIDKHLDRLLKTIIDLHRQQLIHEDPHLANFVYSKEQLYVLDAGAVRKTENEYILMDNLALFIAQFPASWQVETSWLKAYADALFTEDQQEHLDYLSNAVNKQRQQRENRVLRKIYRECTAFHVVSELGYRVVMDREFSGTQLAEWLSDPFVLFDHEQAEILKDGRSSTVARVKCCDYDLVVKRHNIKHIGHRVKRVLTESRASRSWRNAHLMKLRGLRTARPIAMVEYLRGKASGMSMFVMAYQKGVSSADFFRDTKRDDASREQAAKHILKLLSEIKRQAIRHGDLKSTNFILHDKQVSLIDLDAMKCHRSGPSFEQRFAKDVERFQKNWEDDSETASLFERLYAKYQLVAEN